MGQILHFQAGQCGNHLGSKFWQTILDEHSIDLGGKYVGEPQKQGTGINTFLSEGMGGRYVPRAIAFDLDSEPINALKANYYGKLFRQDNLLVGSCSTGNNWCKGHYTEGAQRIDEVLDMARREAEDCDSLQGFQLVHSIGGGTGSGMGTLLVTKLREEYPDRIFQAFTVFPSASVSDTVVEPYNAVLSIHHLIENTDSVMVLDNQALFFTCFKTLKLQCPTYSDLNHLVRGTMSDVTCSYRFPGQMTCDLRKMTANLVPFPRIHFFTLSHAPLEARGCSWSRNYSASSITQQLFNSKNALCAADPRHGRYISANAIYRGRMSYSQVEQTVSKIQRQNPANFVNWTPDGIKATMCDEPAKGYKTSGTLVANTTAIQQVFERIGELFRTLFRRKAFIHCFSGQGMDEMEFQQAESNMLDIISQYQSEQDVPDEQAFEEEA